MLHGRKELEAWVRSGTSVSSAVIRGIKAEEWVKSDWPETMEAARQVFHADQQVAGDHRPSPVAEPQSMAALLGDFPGCMYETDGREATGRCSNGSGADQDTPDAA